jgi:CheY-like chemotaxis protein
VTIMFPYYHPASILLVDDDLSFLESLRFFFGERFNCLTFQRPSEAIAYLKSIAPDAYTAPDYVMPMHGAVDQFDAAPGDVILQMRTTQISRIFSNPARFKIPSVVVVDYAMPGMTGIEFLQQIRHLPLRRLMLTGRADERTAIDAFNDGLIDSFFMKQEADLPEAISRRIDLLQKEFFAQRTTALQSMLATALPFSVDPDFAAAFETISGHHKIVEYCVVTDPPGVLGLRADGSQTFFLIVDADYTRAAVEIAHAEGAPPELIELLQKGEAVALFPTPNGFFRASMAKSWKRFVLPSSPVAGQRTWRCAVVEKPSDVGIGLATYASYDDFLNGNSEP